MTSTLCAALFCFGAAGSLARCEPACCTGGGGGGCCCSCCCCCCTTDGSAGLAKGSVPSAMHSSNSDSAAGGSSCHQLERALSQVAGAVAGRRSATSKLTPLVC